MELLVNKVICPHLSHLITQKTEYITLKVKFVIYWTVKKFNWLHLWNASRYQAEILTQDRYEPVASFKAIKQKIDYCAQKDSFPKLGHLYGITFS